MRIKLLLHVINFYNSIIIILLKLIVLNDNYNYVFQLAILDKKMYSIIAYNMYLKSWFMIVVY